MENSKAQAAPNYKNIYTMFSNHSYLQPDQNHSLQVIPHLLLQLNLIFVLVWCY
jgi:hypothetical protein